MKKYIIRKNKHYSFNNPLGRIFSFKWNVKKICCDFYFANSCWYKKRNSDDEDINKLCGIKIGIFGIHKNSVRFGWKPCFDNPNKIMIYSYCYINGKREFKELCYVETENMVKASILINRDNIIFKVNKVVYVVWLTEPFKKGFGFKCFPYFGGNNKAPNNIKINLTQKLI